MKTTDTFSRFSSEAQAAIERAGRWAHADGAHAIDVLHLRRALEADGCPVGVSVAHWTPEAKRSLELSLRHSLRLGHERVELEDLLRAISDLQGTLEPPVQDSSGYCIRERDLEFLSISAEQVGGWRRRAYPLGMSSISYPAFKEGLQEALLKDALAPAGCDVRLKGSAAEFFSGPHKLLPRTKPELVKSYFDLRERTPETWELEEIVDRLDRRWLSDGIGPRRRPFDSMHRLGIAQYPSDLDVQLSSDELVARCEEILEREAHHVEGLTVKNPTYDFVQPYLVEKAADALYRFGLRMTDRLAGRHVGIKVFPSSGPIAIPGDPLSSHFRETDWKIDLRSARHEAPAA